MSHYSEKDLESLVRFSFSQYFPARHSLHKHHADKFTGVGPPDFYGHFDGLFINLELKVAPNRFTPQQQTSITMTRATGGAAFGILWDNGPLKTSEGKCYLIVPTVVAAFTYRDKSQWIPLLVRPTDTKHGVRPRLDLNILETLVRNYLPKPLTSFLGEQS